MGQKERNEFFDKIYEHSNAKLSLLKSYAIEWMRKVTLGLNGKCLIIDSFAGTGYYEDGSKGSPIIILEEAYKYCEQIAKNNFKVSNLMFMFIEKNKNNFILLKKNLENFLGQELFEDKVNAIKNNSKIFIWIINDSHENFVDDLTGNVDNIVPTLLFIDPFGYKPVPLTSISKILSKYNNCEILINFMYEEVNRFFLKEDNESFIKTIKKFYGENFDKVKEQIHSRTSSRRDLIIDGYKENLKSINAKYVLDFDIEKKIK